MSSTRYAAMAQHSVWFGDVQRYDRDVTVKRLECRDTALQMVALVSAWEAKLVSKEYAGAPFVHSSVRKMGSKSDDSRKFMVSTHVKSRSHGVSMEHMETAWYAALCTYLLEESTACLESFDLFQ